MTNEWVKRPQGTQGAPAGLGNTTRVLYRLLLDDEIHNDVAGNLMWRDGPGAIAEYKVITLPKVAAQAPAVPPDWLASDFLRAPVGVGDVAGTTLGSAARFNAGKPDLSLIPAGVIAELHRWSDPHGPRPAFRVDWNSVLATLDDFQMRRDVDFRNTLYLALHLMDNDGKIWAEIARVFAYGRSKYAERGDCTCHAGNAVRRSMPRVETASAAVTMRKTFGPATQSLPNANSRTGVSGTPGMPTPSRQSNVGEVRSESSTPSTKSKSGIDESKTSTDWSGPSTTGWLASGAPSAHQKTDPTLTTTTPPGGSEEYFAIPATSALDFSNGLTAGLNSHELTCGVHRIVGRGGEWNWARGQAWSIPIASWMRHIVFGTLQGEEIDPESGLSHRGHIGCNVVMLLWFLENYPEGDDRYTPPLPHV